MSESESVTSESCPGDATSPDTPRLLWLHGGGVASWMWGPVLEELNHAGEVIVPDLPGHGERWHETYQSHESTLAWLIGLLEDRAGGPTIVIGFSLGGQLAIMLASSRPDLVDGAIVVSAQAIPSRVPSLMSGAVRLAAPLTRSSVFNRAQARAMGVPARLVPQYLISAKHISPQNLEQVVQENISFRVPPQWRDFAGEVAILVGARESRVTKRSALALARANPRAVLHSVKAAKHDLPLRQPILLAQLISQMSKRVGP